MHKIFYAPDGGCGSGQIYRLTLQAYYKDGALLYHPSLSFPSYVTVERYSDPINGLTKRIRENSIRIERSLHNKGRPKISNCSFRVSGLVDIEELHSMTTFPKLYPQSGNFRWEFNPIELDKAIYLAVLSTSDGNFQDDDPPPPVGDPSRVFTGILELPDAITFKGNVVETDLTIWDPIWLLKNNIVKKANNEPPPQEGDPNFDEELEEWKLRKNKKPVQVFTYDPDRVVFDPWKQSKSLLHLLYNLLPQKYREAFSLDDSAPAINYKAPFHEFDGGTNIAKAIGDVLQSHHHALIADKSGRIKPVDLYLSDTNEEEMPPLECDIRTERIRIKNKEIKHDGIWMSFRRVKEAGKYLIAKLNGSRPGNRKSANRNYNVVFEPDLSDIKRAEIKPIHFQIFKIKITVKLKHFLTNLASRTETFDRKVDNWRADARGWRGGGWAVSHIYYWIDPARVRVRIEYSNSKASDWPTQSVAITVHSNVTVAYDSPEFYVYTPNEEAPNNPKEVKADRLYAVANKTEHARLFNKVAATYFQLEEFAARTCTFTMQKEPTLGGLYTIELPLNEEVVREHITYKKYKKLSVRMQEIRTKVYTDRSVNEYECTCEIIKPVETLYQMTVYGRLLSVRVPQRAREWDKEIEQLVANGWSIGGRVYDVCTYFSFKTPASNMFHGLGYHYHYCQEGLRGSTPAPSSISVDIRGWGLFRLSQDEEIELIKLSGDYIYNGVNTARYSLHGVRANGDRFSLNSRERRINANVHVEYIYLAIQTPFERMTGSP